MMNNEKGWASVVIHAGELYNCILNQGDITVKTTNVAQTISATNELERGDFVELDYHIDSKYDYTHANTPILQYNSSPCTRIGQLISDIRWIEMPNESQHNWGEMLRKSYYQYGVIQFFKSVFLSDNNRYIPVEEYYKKFKGDINGN